MFKSILHLFVCTYYIVGIWRYKFSAKIFFFCAINSMNIIFIVIKYIVINHKCIWIALHIHCIGVTNERKVIFLNSSFSIHYCQKSVTIYKSKFLVSHDVQKVSIHFVKKKKNVAPIISPKLSKHGLNSLFYSPNVIIRTYSHDYNGKLDIDFITVVAVMLDEYFVSLISCRLKRTRNSHVSSWFPINHIFIVNTYTYSYDRCLHTQ